MADSKKYDGSQWEHSLRKLTTATEAVETPLYSDGTAITAYTLKGNTVQNGTPTPSNPVEVNGVGVRTENLYNGGIKTGGWSATTGSVPTSNASNERLGTNEIFALDSTKEYTIAVFPDTLKIAVMSLDNDNKMISDSGWSPSNYQPISGASAIVASIKNATGTAISLNDCEGIIIVEGNSAPATFEPYGYKIPISSGGVTTNLYLGSTQTVRQIKKLVLDGTENWQGSDTSPTKNLTLEGYAKISGISCVSTHYNPANNVDSGDPIPYDSCCFYIGSSNVVYLKGNESDTYPKTITDFKAYLAQQYANGTPVTIWYVLANPETAAVNEPLMKIGTYADTLSNAASIPTTEGANSITVDTTVQPSEFTATWTGWHDATVKEWDGSEW